MLTRLLFLPGSCALWSVAGPGKGVIRHEFVMFFQLMVDSMALGSIVLKQELVPGGSALHVLGKAVRGLHRKNDAVQRSRAPGPVERPRGGAWPRASGEAGHQIARRPAPPAASFHGHHRP